MPFLGFIDEKEVEGRVAEQYEAERSSKGYVPNYVQMLSYRPDVYDAWANLIGTIRANMDLRRYELATFAAARKLRSSYCSLAHGKILRDKFLGEEGLRALMVGSIDDPVDVAVVDLAAKVAADAISVEATDIDRLRQLGMSDQEILDVILTAAARSFFTKVSDATGTKADREYRQALGNDLAETLAVGRPIEGS
ncbi:MAG: carboxymuconolactone decarboxylase family protein [Acidimicrobiia bacterium]